MTRTITPFKLRTELIADGAKHTTVYKKAEGEATHYVDHLTKQGKRAAKAFDGAGAGAKFGKDFSVSAIASLGDSFNVSTLGSLIGTAVAPGIGTAIGSAIGGGIDKALSTVTPIVLNTISSGMELNKVIEETRLEFKTLVGSEQEANKYLTELLDISKDLGIMPQVLIDTSEKLSDLTGDLKLTRTLLKASADQAADFGGGVETFNKIADALGLIVEKGELSNRELMKMYRLGINAKKILAEATGLQERQIDQLIKSGRLRGDVAARLIAEGIERDKGGLAGLKTSQTVAGRERQNAVLMQLRAAEGTQNITRGYGDYLREANALLNSSQGKQFVAFIDRTAGQVIDWTEKGIKAGVSLGGGFAQGLMDGSSLTSLMGSFTKLKDWTGNALSSVFEIKSPSQWSAREVGEPLGEGIGIGLVRRFSGFMQGEGADSIKTTLEELLKDPKIEAFLELISKSETGKSRSQSTGRLFGPLGSTDASQYFSATGGWPGMRVFSPTLRRQVYTSPLGGGQIVKSTAKDFSRQTGLNVRMDQRGQDMIMTWLISRTPGALEKIRGGDIAGAMKLLGGTWESFQTYNRPGTASASKLISDFGAGSPITAANPLPVRISAGAGKFLDDLQSFTASNLASFRRGTDGAAMPDLIGGSSSELDRTVSTIQDGGEAIVNITDATQDLITTTAQMVPNNALILQTLPPVLKAEWELAQARASHASNAIALTKEYQSAAREELIVGMSVIDRVQGMLAQVTGMIPSQEVGKKRGLFSKILGFAAPFLSFIPGVGPILSTIAGAASNIAGGNYGAAVSGIAGGFATGGVFRGTPRTPKTVPGRAGRAYGGPVYAGQSYIVGEHRREVFEPSQNGYVHPSVDQFARSRGGGGGNDILDRLTRALERMESMSPDEVVRFGARGLSRAMDRDASLAEDYGRRLNLGR